MYNMGTDTYTCDICGFEEAWDAHDDHRGDMWECENCGSHFCTTCFMKVHGREEFDRMLRETDGVYCPNCYGEVTIRAYLIFEEETSKSYPFQKKYDDLEENEMDAIVKACEGRFDTETIHNAIGETIGFAEVRE